jgi:hypothetical protein
MTSRLVTLTAACLLAGCAPQMWDKPGATEVDFSITKSQCEARALSLFPRELVSLERQQAPQQQIIIQNDSFSTTRPPLNYISSLPPSRAPIPLIIDYNQASRNRAFTACLLEQGWRPVDSKGNPAPLR